MEYSLKDKYDFIKNEIVKINSKNPVEIVREMMHKDQISIHGPEHHFLDGASFLVAYKNAGGDIDLSSCLDELEKRTVKMPGAMCAYWGVCGSVASVGASLSIIHGTQPLSTDEYYKDNMEYTSGVLAEMSKIGGARCCKRNAFLSLSHAVRFANGKYGTTMESEDIVCEFSSLNKQCLGEKCPFHRKGKSL
ncbi:MAG: DUF5714 domain-containing protein [Eubacteriales bacterium]